MQCKAKMGGEDASDETRVVPERVGVGRKDNQPSTVTKGP